MSTATLDYIVMATEAKLTGPDRWSGHCPSHGSKQHRDLSIKLAAPRILVHCFAGCPKLAICASLGIELKDLFTNALDRDPQKRHAAARQRDRQRQAREQQSQQEGTLIDLLREADYFIRSRCGIDITTWTDDRLNDELNLLADAYHLLEHEALHG